MSAVPSPVLRLSRRRFIQATAASAVLVHVSNGWSPVVSAADDTEKDGDKVKDKDDDKRSNADESVRADVRFAAILGPPEGRSRGNVLVRSWSDKQTTTTTWFAGGGRALSITTRTKVDKKARAKPKPVVRYVDPRRSVDAVGERLVPLAELEQEIRTEFGDHEWSAMLQRLG